MNRTFTSFLSILTVIAFVTIDGCGKNVIRFSLAMQKVQGGCISCHVKLLEKLPKSHFKVTIEEVKYCLICHSREGPSADFYWVIHFRHYSKPESVKNCWSCHLIDESGSFRLIGAIDKNEIKVTKDRVERMGSYLKSWAASENLDYRHAQRSVTCHLCHGTFFPEERVSMEQCLRCHSSYEHLAALTKDVHPNPHNSHLGEIRCTLCHKVHQKSALFCTQCHTFNLKLPGGKGR